VRRVGDWGMQSCRHQWDTRSRRGDEIRWVGNVHGRHLPKLRPIAEGILRAELKGHQGEDQEDQTKWEVGNEIADLVIV